MMTKILQQDIDPNSHKKTPILSKTKENKKDCVSTNLTVAVNSKIITHIITPDKIEKISLRPIVSNIGTATHKVAKYLCKLLTPLGKSKYTIDDTKKFVDTVKNLKAPKGYKMISFDVVSLFTNVPSDKTIDIILRKVYDEKKIKTKIKR